MAEPNPNPNPNDHIPKLTQEQRQQVAKSFTHAKQALASGNLDYAIDLLIGCLKRCPADIPMRQELRRAEKLKFKDNKKGKPFAGLANFVPSLKMKSAAKKGQHLKAIEIAEDILQSNPWSVTPQLVSAQSFLAMGLKDLALWTLDQARQVDSMNPVVNRQMALLFEDRGQFNQAMALWKLVAQKLPQDKEAAKKANDLAAQSTIQRGQYEAASTGQAASPAKAFVEKPRGADGEATETLAEQRMAKDVEQATKKIEENPTSANAYLHLAQLYRRNDFLDKARETLKKGLDATGKHFDLAMEALDVEIEPLRRDLAACEEKLRKDPKNAELTATRGKLTKEINTRELAYFRQKSDRYPTDSLARFEMAVRLFKTAQYDPAIEELQKVRSDPKLKTRVLVYLGLSFKARNNWRLAQRNFEEALPLIAASEESFRKEVMYHLACGYADNGELQRGIDLGCELANLDYGYRNIGNLIEEWQKKRK